MPGPTSTHDAETLRDAIVDGLRTGAWQPGHRIPTERSLSETYGIGRSAVRRVLSQLKAQGLIRQTVGSGTYVSDPVATASGADTAAGEAVHTSPSELMEARIALEPALVDLVIHNATAADFARMDACCAAAESATSLAMFEHWDRELHELIAEAAHNAFVMQLFRTMGRARSQAEWGMLKLRSVTPERRLEYQREHRDIVDALKERDLARAMRHTHGHLLHVRRNLLGY